MKKVVLITGTSSGLGLEAALLYAKNNHRVFATMRNLEKSVTLLEKAKEVGVNVDILQLDVTDTASIQNCIDQVIEQAGRIDILVNNAGAGFAKTTEHATEEEIQWVTDVNYFGVVRCTKAVLMHMRKQQSGHVINISSVGGLVGQPFNELYCAAKFAVEGYTEGLATYLTSKFGIQFSIVEPGGIVSDFMTSAMQKTVTNGELTIEPYQSILEKYMTGIRERAASGESQVYQTAEQVAKVVFDVSQKSNPPLRVRTSGWAEEFCRFKTQADPDGTKQVEDVIKKFLT
ncbi:MAG: SDR family oxidoreductase [Calditrichia bacterium]